MQMTRRSLLARSAALGCSLAASPLLTPVTFAAAPWDTRLVVVILRGGMDALDVVQPYGDPDYAGLRQSLAGGPAAGAADLDGFYALHPALAPLLPLWRAGQLGFVQAVSTPYRDRRSHFDGQDLLEAGTAGPGEAEGGWLNRLLQQLPGVEARTAFAIGQERMLLMEGGAPVSQWAPGAGLAMSPQAERLAGLLMEEDPLFRAALNEALELTRQDLSLDLGQEDGSSDEGEDMMMSMMTAPKGKAHQEVAAYAAQQLRGETRIAAFSINGWDTHQRQANGLKNALGRLSEAILTLQSGLGPQAWGKTAVVAVSEFGRTVRENGTGGTDHGTGGAMLLAGGAIRGGRVLGRWPGLAETDLYDRRDLMPTADVRGQLAWLLHGLTGAGRSGLQANVFPGLDMGADPGLLL
ncbi:MULTISPECIES: DUF1501 domain-containing protein [unclassified Leisingera]|uniref:DUF1501 domain-containing protein n=1 Tax=unclassified Leisingera TaxID=2614906 RepID=UPI0003105989|nr:MULTISPECIES: DUF1501 domain-containing protein [unclassified Leisingera]KIC23126.1 twin-arginine translocation pathway signal [Leisingera sp. ANG-S3]KIC49436.1 twin-arginine translocation pathway signal [Leisingera sp. ANG-S]KID09477.1 twin-arginine translocation pathway signal [Leisingera sp. ANG1]